MSSGSCHARRDIVKMDVPEVKQRWTPGRASTETPLLCVLYRLFSTEPAAARPATENTATTETRGRRLWFRTYRFSWLTI